MSWKKFKPSRESFDSDERYENYLNSCKCGVCHKRLEVNDEFDLRPIQTPQESGSLNVIAVIVHRKCTGE